jgi:rRNA maturation endonuclease Nob1
VPTTTTYDESEALERMLDDGAPIRSGLQQQVRAVIQIVVEQSAEERAAERRAARRRFRLYCLACGRSAEGATIPTRSAQSRCAHCGGSLLVEPTSD